MKCPNCGQEAIGKFCNYCGCLLEPDKASDDILKELNFDEISWKELNSPEVDSQKTTLPESNSQKSSSQKLNSQKSSSQKLSSQKSSSQKTGSQRVRQRPNKSAAASNTTQKATQNTTVNQKTKVKTRNKKRKKRGNPLSSISSVTFKGAKGIWKTILLAAQWISCALMVYSIYRLALGFWAQRVTLGSMAKVLQERNFAQGLYLVGAVCILGFGILQVFWIISRKKLPDHGRIRRIDMGRGILGFVVYLLLALAALYINPLIPSSPDVLIGGKQLLSVVGGLGNSFLIMNMLGAVLCVARKVGTR